MTTEKYAYIETFGCQMNVQDSETMAQLLADADYMRTEKISQADLIVVNTCSVRKKAEDKAYSMLGRLRKLKKKKPSLIIAMAGCVAQQEQGDLFKRMPYLDIVLGPQNIFRLPQLVDNTGKNGNGILATGLSPSFKIPFILPEMESDLSHSRFVTIMQGCNNFCTYCIVPYTRGREISRPVDDILNEISHLVENGVKEVTLLGQNVNSYGKDCKSGNNSSDALTTDFPGLLRLVAKIPGLLRIRFTTSHPKDLSEDLMRCFEELSNLCPHFHLPVQAGSNRILKLMNRRYTIETYLKKVEKLRQYRPDIAITTDIIVGFPGETREDFEATMDLVNKVRYHGAFSFKYSNRPGVKASGFKDQIEEREKSERLTQLQARQKEITMERNREYEGRQMAVMIEKENMSSRGQWRGRTETNHVANIEASGPFKPGQIIQARITEACYHSLRGVSI
ncbi:MAG: tRNA (N6-isopentenyl adenosine(37)-C2)-methylthiotransferase MiaB [Desulfobulbaceae bacterium]|nr:tRNA (N6-isopentenyl adenosine(37)-C2)-methylthiotransferase MiaB [Desulfobulbaceae bacterium]MCK5437199.1 tRNA (N6-isopentenyl adenosine(37)-C2)-methylthiotransferase MiaB [Desulfobulbaceae bacterium]